jgi:hypothetical protein
LTIPAAAAPDDALLITIPKMNTLQIAPASEVYDKIDS